MTYRIDEDLCVSKGLSVEELLVALLVKSGANIDEVVTAMLNRKVLVHSPSDKKRYLITQRWDNVISEILLSKDPTIPAVKDLETLAVKMARLFPTGVKAGTNVYWKGNRKDIVQKLQKFFKLYGQYTEEDVLAATEQYVNKNKNNLTTMRVLKYFILKDNESDLATTLENINQPDVNADQLEIDWETELR